MTEEVNPGDPKNGDVEKSTNFTHSDEVLDEDMKVFAISPSCFLQQPPGDTC
jgi:hypothetical protein